MSGTPSRASSARRFPDYPRIPRALDVARAFKPLNLEDELSDLRLRDSIMTISTVWRRAFLDAIIAPRRFRKVMPELRTVSDMVFHPGIGTLDATQLPADDSTFQMLPINSECGGMTAQDLYALLRIVHWLRPRRVFEIGTFQGMTTAHLALNSDAEIFTLDLPREQTTDLHGYSAMDRTAALRPRDEVGREYRKFNAEGRIRQLFGDSKTFDYTPYRASMDVVLIDACHLFDYVISDSRNALQMLGERGAILWHDFPNSLDVTRACKLRAKELQILHVEGTWLALYLRGIPVPGAVCAAPVHLVE